jgi:hypothetical protein
MACFRDSFTFINIGLGIQKLTGGYTDKQAALRSHKPTFIFIKVIKIG